MSSGDRHERLETLFEQALRRPPEDRERFLEDHAGSDPELLEELRSLLAQADADPGFLDRLAEGVVARGAADALDRIRHRRLDRGLRDRYRLRDRIGRGGMATVYVAEDVRHQRSVALKVLEPAVAASMGAERFLTEIRTTANLQHPHILPLFDSGEVDGLLYYVMPYVEGETLRERLDREGQLPVDDAVGIAGELADALDHAHRHGVVHRDLKPDNVLLHEGKAYLTDFGIALAVERAESGGRLTETGLSIGTPHYMSPEQATGEDRVGPPSDQYSLGCLLYEMLLGEPPHTGPTAQAIFARILTE
ncbi:MAG TPA: serine/threonine-protein kinase, partial [Longimicrobiales bacterium]|nr:serine/threonine-protein kinase [Longimicrobiales bacterium]